MKTPKGSGTELMKHSEFSLIPMFIAVMEEKNLSVAAKKLGVSQPAISQGLTRLRALYQDELFIRDGKGFVPTAYANSIYPSLLKSMNVIMGTVPEQFKFNPKTCNRRFTISALSVFNHTFFVPLCNLIKEKAPLCTIEILPIVSDGIESLMRFEQIDLLIEVENTRYPTLKKQLISSDSLSIIYSKSHPRLGSSVTEEAFLNEEHVVHTQHGPTLGYLSNDPRLKCLSERRISWSVSSIVDMFPLLASSDMVGIMPNTVAEKYCGLFNLHNIQNSFISQELNIAMYWHPRRQHDPAHKWLRSMCKEAAMLNTPSIN